MKEIKGNYNTAKCFIEDLDSELSEQILSLCDSIAFKHNDIRIMPDAHIGQGCTIGTTMVLKETKVVPSHVGVDIGCGVSAAVLENSDFNNFELLDKTIRENVPAGFNIHESPNPVLRKFDLLGKLIFELRFLKKLGHKRAGELLYKALCSVGTLGGGNHFIELDKSEDGELLLVVHSGSRNLGLQCCKFYEKQTKNTSRNKSKELIRRLKKEGRESEIETELKKLQFEVNNENQKYLEGQDYLDYFHDMKIIQQFANYNRLAILSEILGKIPEMGKCIDVIASTHNYIDFISQEEFDYPILRKGAISAYEGEKVIIPLNMKDGLIVAEGMGNPDWNCSAPHGAGRVLSRTQARQTLDLGEYQKEMEGIFSNSISQKTIDEAPMAYKDADSIINMIDGTTVKNIKRYYPVYNFKAE